MAQGTRGRLVRAATAGFGVVLCTGLLGCMNGDKPKDTKSTAQPKPGLPGLQTLPANGGAAANTKASWQPGAGQYNGPGANLQQAGGFGTAGASGQFRSTTNGMNTNTSTAGPSLGNYPAQPGNPGGLGPAAPPAGFGPSVLPASGTGGAAPVQNTGSVGLSSSPPPPDLILPPPPPSVAGAPVGGAEYASGAGVLPPSPAGGAGPIAPLPPPGLAPAAPVRGGF